MRAHGADQFAAARRQRDAAFQCLIDDADRQPLQQRHAFAQRRLERDFAAHGALCDGGDMGLEARKVRQFVDAFLADHGGIHVGEKKLLAPADLRLHDNIDRQVFARLAQAIGNGVRIVGAGERDIDCNLVEQPVRRTGRW